MSSRLRGAGISGLAVGFGGFMLCLVPLVLELEEAAGLQWLFRLRGALPAPSEVVIIGISGASAEALGVSSDLDEWPRYLHADLIDRLAEAGAAVIVMDIIFQEHGVSEHDRQLAESIDHAGNVILLDRVRSRDLAVFGTDGPAAAVLESRIRPIEPFARGALATAPFTLPTVPIKTGQFWTFGRAASDIPNVPVVALQAYALPVYSRFIAMLTAREPAAMDTLPATWDELLTGPGLEPVVRSIRGVFQRRPALAGALRTDLEGESLSPWRYRLIDALIDMYAGRESRYINYYGASGTIKTVAFHEALQSTPEELNDFTGKTVFVGFSEDRQSEQQDAFISVYSQRSGLNLSGVEIGATAFSNLLSRESIQPLTMSNHLLLIFAWGVLLATGLAYLSTVQATLVALVTSALYFAASWYSFQSSYVWTPLLVPILVQAPAALAAAILLNYRDVNLQRQRILAALGHYVPADVVTRLAQDSVSMAADRQLVYGTCLVTDAEQFTRLSESLAPERLGELMGAYYQVLRDAVQRHEGYVADISGDSMVAIWTAAKPDAQLKLKACTAGLDLLTDIATFNRQQGALQLPTGIGLDYGELLLGNIGFPQQYHYRAVGDIVNSASRIQGLNRQLGTHILLSAAVLESLDQLPVRKLGRFLLVGKTAPIDVFELRGAESATMRDWLACEEQFTLALEMFVQRSWTNAKREFLRLLDQYPQDGPSRFYVRQCDEFVDRELPEDWAGTIRMRVK